ncbi:MAG: nucleotidyl transferase AbiEii/AbiGii toxin family protein [Thermoanaerobaculia bacterium]
MDEVAQFSSADRRDLFTQTAASKGIANPEVIEKDFWVCWTLRHLFRLTDLPRLIFKGGTSLSKVYGLIERFSEDVDLAFDRHQLGFEGDSDPATPGLSGKKRQRLLKQLRDEANLCIEDRLNPRLLASFAEVIGPPGRDDSAWKLKIEDATDGTKSIAFEYPSSGLNWEGSNYIPSAVLLEIGARSDHWPSVEASVRSYAAETFPDVFAEPSCKVVVLAAVRTFWEKVTLLHSQYHRNDPRKSSRLSRHYYDTVMMARSEIKAEALAKLDLLTDVAQHKQVFFPAAWAKYSEAEPGSLHLMPKPELETALEKDYEQMAQMFFANPPTLKEIMTELGQLETEINDA